MFTIAKSGHPMEGCTLGGAFIVFGQEMQEFGTLGKLSAYFLCSEYAQSRFCGSCDLRHPVFGTMLQEIIKIVYPPFYLSLHNGGPRRKSFLQRLEVSFTVFPWT